MPDVGQPLPPLATASFAEADPPRSTEMMPQRPAAKEAAVLGDTRPIGEG